MNMEKNNKIKRYISYINNIVLFLIVFFTLFPNEFKILVIVCTILWGINEIILNFKTFINFFLLNKYNYIIYFSIIFYIIIRLCTDVKFDIITLIGVCFVSILFLYYKSFENKVAMRIITVAALLGIVLTNIFTYIAMIRQPQICRILSTAGGIEKVNINPIGVASYSHIYSYIFIELALLYSILNIKSNKKIKIISIIVFLLNLIILIKAQFVIAYITLLLGVILIIAKINNIKKLLIFLLIVLCISVILLPIIQTLCEYLSEKVESNILKSRFAEIAFIIKNKSLDSTEDISERIKVYQKSVNIIKQRPILGLILKENNMTAQPGGHSTLLDLFANFGILGTIPLIASYIYIIYNIKSYKYRKIFFILIVILFILGIINNILLAPIACTIFTIIPSYMELILKEEEDENTLDS